MQVKYAKNTYMDQNVVYASQNLNSLKLWTREVKLKDVILRHGDDGRHIQARIRHRAPLVDADYSGGKLTFVEEQKSLTPGQSIVFYRGDICLGGGIIDA